jgi:dTDP-4-amino-4,6-dideoxygalactose transaminase
MKIPQIDLVAQYETIREEIDAAIHGVLRSGHFILGPQVQALEREVAAYLGVRHAVGLGSGTDALVLGLRALGIGPGDEVIVPSYTFFATAEAVMLVGADPVFVDVDPETYCIDVDDVATHVTARTRAVMPVHLYGHPADMTRLREVAASHRLRVIEDNAQALGADWRGRKTGGMGDLGCLSFYPSKNLGAYGDAGMAVTNDDTVAAQLRMLRTHGWRRKYHPEMLGYNSRLDEMQAAILRVKLRHLDAWTRRRVELAEAYAQRLASLDVGLPIVSDGATHVFHVYVVRLRNRQAVEAHLLAREIGTAIYYPRPLHDLEPCRPFAKNGAWPHSEAASRETLALPFFPEMTEGQVDAVVAALADVVTPRSR